MTEIADTKPATWDGIKKVYKHCDTSGELRNDWDLLAVLIESFPD
jgi:hypothetical protein